MKVLLVAINAKYIHSNLAVRYLKSYAEAKLPAKMSNPANLQIEIAEYTINQQKEDILADIYGRQPDFLAFSCYIWNMEIVSFLIEDYHSICPRVPIWLGGPEVSFDGEDLLEKYAGLTGVMCGEGEQIFTDLLQAYLSEGYETEANPCEKREELRKDIYLTAGIKTDRLFTGEKTEHYLSQVKGIVYRKSDGKPVSNAPAAIICMDEIPFVYGDMQDLEHKIIYYESSRGCPFACSYCLSSLDRVRFRDTEQVCKELQFFIDARVPQVKFVDRTFNCRHGHAQAIWRYIKEHDQGITNFHFEIAADLLNEEELQLLSEMRPGLVQLEIGVQSANMDTIREIDRVMDLDHLQGIVERIRSGRNIHQHLDLIAGLPNEDYESFRLSFNRVYEMRPDQLQLGFLKVLKGSKMNRKASSYDMVYSHKAPYEIYQTRWISYDRLLELKAVEEMVEVYYNSLQFSYTIEALSQEQTLGSAFDLFHALADYYKEKHLEGLKHSRLERFDILRDFILEKLPAERHGFYEELLLLDLYLRENSKKRPAWAEDHPAYKKFFRDFYMREDEMPEKLIGYEKYDSKQMARMTHAEVFMHDLCGWGGSGPYPVVFDYQRRDPLSGNARVIRI